MNVECICGTEAVCIRDKEIKVIVIDFFVRSAGPAMHFAFAGVFCKRF